MQNLILNFFQEINFSQAVLVTTIAVILYYKIKKEFINQVTEIKKEINGLGQRFDNQFGDYKDKNQEEFDKIKERVYKLEIEASISNQNKHLLEKINQILGSKCDSEQAAKPHS
ncbi:MAG: hypothetical protein V2B14_01105 [bacterium]